MLVGGRRGALLLFLDVHLIDYPLPIGAREIVNLVQRLGRLVADFGIVRALINGRFPLLDMRMLPGPCR